MKGSPGHSLGRADGLGGVRFGHEAFTHQLAGRGTDARHIVVAAAALAERDATILRQVEIISEAGEKLRRAEAEKKIIALRIEQLEARIHKLLRQRFGSTSEKLEQLRLSLEDLETDQSEEAKGDPEEKPEAPDQASPPRNRKLSDKLKRRTVVREPKSKHFANRLALGSADNCTKLRTVRSR